MSKEAIAPVPFLVDGAPAPGRGTPFESINPHDGSLVAVYAGGNEEDVNDAVASAVRAQADPAWRSMLPHKRASILHRISDLIERDADILAELQKDSNGKLLRECQFQVMSAQGIFRFFAGLLETDAGEVAPSRGAHMAMTIYEPFGVVAAITPWNSPLTLECQKVAAALAAGNAVILKPSEFTPSVGLHVAKLAIEAGLPKGLFNVLNGMGAEVGSALVRHPDVNMISFTGGTATGRAIAKIAGERLVPTALELGGKSPHIVFADADIESAAHAVVKGIFTSSGQSCIAGSRLFVETSIYDSFVERIIELTRDMKVGAPDDPDAKVAPLASFVHRDRVESYVKLAREDGGRVLIGGKRPEGAEFAKGAYFEPTIIDGLSNDSRACQEEIFGPVLCVLPFEDEQDLIHMANDTVYGLAAGIWTEDFKKAWRLARAIESGTVWVNTYKDLSVSVPFGGMKDSGIQREKGVHGLRVYQEPKTVFFGL